MSEDELTIELVSNDIFEIGLSDEENSFSIDLLEDELSVELVDNDILDIDLDASEDEFSIDIMDYEEVENDYNKLINKPSINGVELIGDKSFADLHLIPIPHEGIMDILEEAYDEVFGGGE